MSEGDASGGGSDGDASGGGMAGGVSGSEEAAWRDLVARYEMPADSDGAPAPWPDREDLPDGQNPPASAQPSAFSADRPAGEDSAAGEGGADGAGNEGRQPPARGTGRARVIRPAAKPPAAPPSAPSAAPAGLEPPPSPSNEEPDEDDDTGEYYIPPPPPPLPRLDPVAKGAWTALFGGPAYLFVSTLVGWSPPGWAALLAVAAFVGGFAVIVLRMGDKPSRGDGPDNGAVV